MRMAETGYRRRILIEPAPGRVVAELEDDYHRMVVALDHHDGVVTRVESDMKRGPWTSCPGAMDTLEQTFVGTTLADFVARGDKTLNCTHLYDLSLFAAAHAHDEAATAYDIVVTDAVDTVRCARLARNGVPLLEWHLEGDLFRFPADLAGTRLHALGPWIAGLDKAGAEAWRILRWATIIAQGRGMDIPAGLPATAFASGACFTFQPETAGRSFRRPGADIDFSAPGLEPMADRAARFNRSDAI
ncbi:DUF2889 domain-containing protein [Sphingomonas sp. BIUV-7]|uniref:DUF2889 domain-containing protein n=1 Tax=Sphingomonas natans TaxID=3063330 RepID=A0ABT8Y910_9SPHN|nr:DUF2889 domain-containing protein [Sphingomonas sp. BIUV-7]MDO6414462.1 DUF2889 domain-containing protein [Sphingomonas sp. BIUV-7]